MTDPIHAAVLLLQGAILATLFEGLRRGNVAAAVNALASLLVALLPALVESALQVSLGEVLALWLGAAGFLHSLGMLGPYETIWWWDHLTHTVSAALVAALLYAGLVVSGRALTGVELTPALVAVATVLCVLGIGVFWELIELVARAVGERIDVEPVLVHYGWRDTAFDLGFDLLGALLVVLFDVRAFVSLVDRHQEAAATALVWGGWAVVVSSGLLVVVLALDRRWSPRGA